MNPDRTEQEDELLALQSIFNSEEFLRDEPKCSGECRVSAELPAGFSVLLTEGGAQRRYEISFLPPLLLTLDLPEDYPSCSPPSFSLTCSWMSSTQLSALSAQLVDLYWATGGAVILFSWIQFLKEEALLFLNIHHQLELPPDGVDPDPGPSEADSRAPSLTEAAEEREASEDLPPGLNVASDPADSVRSSTDPEDQEGSSGEEDVSSAVLLSTSSDPSGPGRPAAAAPSLHSRDLSPDQDRSCADVSTSASQALLSQILICDAAQKQKVFDGSLWDCGVCLVSWLGSQCVQLSQCGHVFCQTCFTHFCEVQITEGNVRGLTCPQADCTATPTPAQVQSLVGEKLFRRYDRLLLQVTLDGMSDVVYCPRSSCAAAVIQEESGRAALCSVCGFAFCVICRKTYHGQDDCQQEHRKDNNNKTQADTLINLPESKEGRAALWDDYVSGSKRRKRVLERRYGRDGLNLTLESELSEEWVAINCKHCPHCFCNIQKVGGCNMMLCWRCHRVFCWVCLRGFPSHKDYQHHLSCPFYRPPQ